MAIFEEGSVNISNQSAEWCYKNIKDSFGADLNIFNIILQYFNVNYYVKH